MNQKFFELHLKLFVEIEGNKKLVVQIGRDFPKETLKPDLVKRIKYQQGIEVLEMMIVIIEYGFVR